LKRVVLDEGVPRQVIRSLPDYDATTVPASGWASIKNGKLLTLIEQAGFDAFITCDKNMDFQQRQLESRPFAVLLLSTNHRPSIKPHGEGGRGPGDRGTRVDSEDRLRTVYPA